MTTTTERNIAAEARAVEEGHRVFLTEGGARVISDSYDGKEFRVQAHSGSAGTGITFVCEPSGRKAFSDDHMRTSGPAGVCPCKHSALVARRLEREGLAKFSGGFWVATAKAEALASPTATEDDPFEGIC